MAIINGKMTRMDGWDLVLVSLNRATLGLGSRKKAVLVEIQVMSPVSFSISISNITYNKFMIINFQKLNCTHRQCIAMQWVIIVNESTSPFHISEQCHRNLKTPWTERYHYLWIPKTPPKNQQTPPISDDNIGRNIAMRMMMMGLAVLQGWCPAAAGSENNSLHLLMSADHRFIILPSCQDTEMFTTGLGTSRGILNPVLMGLDIEREALGLNHKRGHQVTRSPFELVWTVKKLPSSGRWYAPKCYC